MSANDPKRTLEATSNIPFRGLFYDWKCDCKSCSTIDIFCFKRAFHVTDDAIGNRQP